MKFCKNCFRENAFSSDFETTEDSLGSCSFCNTSDVLLYDVSEPTVKNALTMLINIYRVASEAEIKAYAGTYKVQPLIVHLKSQWDLFRMDEDKIELFLREVFKDEPYIIEGKLDALLTVDAFYDDEFNNENSIFYTSDWNNFASELKDIYRYNVQSINKEALKKYLSFGGLILKAGTQLYRSRICKTREGYPKEKMGAPDKEHAVAGRINPEGIPYLYLSDDKITNLHEIKALTHDLVTVATFQLKQDLNIFDFTKLSSISIDMYERFEPIAINIPHINDIAKDMSKPLSRSDSNLEYLPTQYICDFIKLCGYEGIKYKSTVAEAGYNLALFDASKAEIVEVNNYKVTSMRYDVTSV